MNSGRTAIFHMAVYYKGYRMDFQQFLQSPGGSPLLYGKVYGMSFGLPWQQVRSILPAHCDSWGILSRCFLWLCFNGLGLPAILFSWLVFSSVYLGSTFGSARHHRLHQSHLECKPIRRSLPSPRGISWLRGNWN